MPKGPTRKWIQLDHCSKTGETWFGSELLEAFDADALDHGARALWYREAVADVRRSIGNHQLNAEADRVLVFRELKIESRKNWWERILFWRDPPTRKRKGMVSHSKPVTIYFSEEGRKKPRIVYEEVAHSLSMVVPSNAPEVATNGKSDPFFETFLANLMYKLGYRPVSVRWPIKCHWLIFRGFLNNSDALSLTDDAKDQRFALKALKTCEECCKVLTDSKDCGC